MQQAAERLKSRRSWRKPKNRRLTYVKPPRQVCLRRRAVGKCLQRIAPLMRGELRGAAHMDAALLGALAAFARARADQLPLKRGKPTHDCTEEGDALSCSMDR